jgi:hypothetical protein
MPLKEFSSYPFFLEWEDGKRGKGFFYAALVGIDIRKENGS